MVSLSILIPAVFFGLIALLMLCYLLVIAFRSCFGDSRSWTEQFRFRQREKVLKIIEGCIERKALAEALKLSWGAFFLDHIKHDSQLVEKVSTHNLSVISKIINISDILGRQLPNLAIIEDLLQTRSELLRAFVETQQTLRALFRSKKKQTPSWALDEYKKKLEELYDRLKTNRRSLESQIKEALGSLQEAQGQSEITYH